MSKVIGKNAKKKAVVSAVIGAVLLMGGGSVLAFGDPTVSYVWNEIDFLPSESEKFNGYTAVDNFKTGHRSPMNIADDVLYFYDSNGNFINYSGLLVYSGNANTELKLSAGATMTAQGDGYGCGWDGVYKIFTNNGTLNAYGSDNNAGFVNSTSFINNGQFNAVGDAGQGYGLYLKSGVFENNGTVVATTNDSEENSATPIYIETGADYINHQGGKLTLTPGKNGLGVDIQGGSFVNEANASVLTYGENENSVGINLDSGNLENHGEMTITTSVDGGFGLSTSSGSVITNDGVLTFKVGGDSSAGVDFGGGTFNNLQGGVVNVVGGTGAESTGVYASDGELVNDGTFNITGGVGTNAYGFYLNDGNVESAAARVADIIPKATLSNTGTINVTGGQGTGYGFYQLSSVTNTGTVAAVGGNSDEQGLGTDGWYMAAGTFTNSGTLSALGGNYQDAYGFYIAGGTVVNDENGVIRNDENRTDAINGGSFYQKAGSFTNKGSIVLVSGNGKSIGFNQVGGTFANEAEATISVSGSSYGAVYGYVLGSNTTFNNSGTLTSVGGSGSQSHGFYQVGGTFTNEEGGVLDLTAGTSASTAGLYQQGGEFVNNGTIKTKGSTVDKSAGFYQFGKVTNNGTIAITGGDAEDTNKILRESYGWSVDNGAVLENAKSGIINVAGGETDYDSSLRNFGTLNNYGKIVNSSGKSGNIKNSGTLNNYGEINFDVAQIGGTALYNYGNINNFGTLTVCGGRGFTINHGEGVIENKVGGHINIVTDSTGGTAGIFQQGSGKIINHGDININVVKGSGIYTWNFTNYGSVTSFGGRISNSRGMSLLGSNLINESGAVFRVIGGETKTSYGLYNVSKAELTNKGTIELTSTLALTAVSGVAIVQKTSDALISGNLLSFADYTEGSGGSTASPVNFVGADNAAVVDSSLFVTKSGEGGIKSMANFLTSKISGGTINITDTDWSEEAQQTIKEAIYGTGVTSDVNITFAGTGDKGFGASYKKTVDLAHARSFVAAGYEGAVLYEDTMNAVSGGLTVGNSSSAMGSLGFKSVASDVVTITDGKALTLLGDGTQLAGTAGKVTVNNGELKLGFIHDVTKDTTQGGELSTVSLADAGKLSVADVNGTYRISDKLSLADKATLTNAGKLSVASVAFAGNNATVTNTGTTVVKTASGSGKGNTLKNAGIYSQTDLSAFGDVQNKGTLKTGTLTVGAADKLVNGGTILAEKITVDGLLQNRNGTFALGTAAVAKYLEKHLDLAQQLKDLGETLPTSVETLLSAQSDAEAATLTTLELADGERPVESDDETSETTESTDFASLFAEIQAAKAPQGRLATREGRLAFAGFSTYADNRGQLERQLQSGLSGLWADFIASQSEMDRYKANRSGIAVGLQGTNDAGMTFGVAARYSDGKLKGDALTSENWTSAGGSTYAAWDNDDAFVSGFIGYDNLKTKGSDKLTNDVVSAGVKSGLKLDVGPVHVTPFVGGEVVHQKVKGLDAATTYRFPVGVELTGQYETYGAWQVHPSLEVAFVPQAGDKVIDVTDKVDSRFAGNYAVESRLGIAVEKKNLMLGINYHGAAGDAGLRSHSLQANVKYRF